MTAYRIAITGVVQGVGFRPFVYNLATRLGLRGWVLNHVGGVEIEAEGTEEALRTFVAALEAEAPPLARIESLTVTPVPPRAYARFEIRPSEAQTGRYQLISPDVATCPDCLRELFDPADRRYRYPFINCTNCGPRFTIITDLPYDRPNTTMRIFPMCESCRAEYENPADRRFHAQPNACPVCGPHVWLVEPGRAGEPPVGEAALQRARELLLAGKVLAIKGLGGFHLACDATNALAVRTLRRRKRRPHKPFAVMVATVEAVRRHAHLSPEAEALFTSPQCPIILLERRETSPIAPEVAPHSHTLGMMIPYTPLHHLILRDVARPLVMTSGNLTEEPIAGENDEALRRLAPLADAFLLHDRPIHTRNDDSVWQDVALEDGRHLLQPVRRARGYAPLPIRLPFETRPMLATGPQLKNTFALARDVYAFLSQHIGDMANLETLTHYEETLATFRHLFRLEPERVVCDLHPDYLTTRWAETFARERGLPAPTRVQHHRAHIAACLADNGYAPDAPPVIGVALDGTGYGDDGLIWGGEWFVGHYDGLRRVAHLEPLPLPGGEAAIRRPERIAVAYLLALLGDDALPPGRFRPADVSTIRRQVARRLNTPATTSMGRLFDAVSALLGVCDEVTYEAQAAIELEQVAAPGGAPLPYPFALEKGGEGTRSRWIVRLAPLFAALVEAMRAGTPVPEIARRFHLTVAEMVTELCRRIRADTALTTVALSGGVFQNRLLLRLLIPRLEAAGFTWLLHRHVPCNDGGIALGQIALAAHET